MSARFPSSLPLNLIPHYSPPPLPTFRTDPPCFPLLVLVLRRPKPTTNRQVLCFSSPGRSCLIFHEVFDRCGLPLLGTLRFVDTYSRASINFHLHPWTPHQNEGHSTHKGISKPPHWPSYRTVCCTRPALGYHSPYAIFVLLASLIGLSFASPSPSSLPHPLLPNTKHLSASFPLLCPPSVSARFSVSTPFYFISTPF